MDTKKLLDILDIIQEANYPKEHEHFGGAHLIVTNKQPRKDFREDYPGDVVVVTPDASELSWLVFQLKEVYDDELDYLNKYGFYPGLGNAMNNMLQRKSTLKEVMLYTVLQSVLFWIISPEIPKKEEIIRDLLEEKAGPVPEPEDDGLTIGQILRANEEGRPIAENRNQAMHEWMGKAMGKETGIKDK